MKWWGYVLIVLAAMLPFYIYRHRQDIKGVWGEFIICRAVRTQKYYIKDFIFTSGGEALFFDYLVVNASGVFAVSVHNLKGYLNHFNGRIFLKGYVNKKKQYINKSPFYKYLNPVPHDVRKIVKLNAYVPEKVDIIPVVVFPRGNDIKLRAMWITPVNELEKIFSEPCDKPLTDREIENLYHSLLYIKVSNKVAKKRRDGFIKRRCPLCGNYVYDAKENGTVYLKCRACSFRRDLTAAVLPEHEDF